MVQSFRTQPHFLAGYISADVGSVSAPTAATLTVDEFSRQIVYNSSTKKITLPAENTYTITVQLNQTGGSALVDIYDSTTSAVIRASTTGAGDKTVIAYVRTTTLTKDIQIRVDDQSANGTLSTAGVVLVQSLHG